MEQRKNKMGYYIYLEDANFHIKKENFEPALQALKNLMAKESELGHGGTYYNGVHTRHFSWIDSTSVLKAETLEAAMEECCWTVWLNKNGDIDGIEFINEKIGDDEYILQAIAPFVEKGSYLNMKGEDGAMWRWEFDGQALIEKQAQITWV